MTVTRKIKITGLLITAVAATALGDITGAAGNFGDDAVRAGIETTIDRAHAILVRGGSVKEFTDTFYEDDVMLSAQGEKTYRGVGAVSGVLSAYMKDGNLARCELKIIDPIRHSGNLATVFIQDHCAVSKVGETVHDARMLLVFRNGPKGWRVTQELAMEGVF